MIGGGLTSFEMMTDNLDVEPGNGWLISLGIGAPLPNKWYDISYNIQILENRFDVDGRISDDVAGSEPVEYKIFTAQAGLVFHVNIIQSYLTLDLGPQLQYNSDLEVTEEVKESYFINGYDALMASEITDINNFNVNGAVGLTAGVGMFKLRGQLIYGLLNSLDKLNEQQLNTGGSVDFKGNPAIFTVSAFLTF